MIGALSDDRQSRVKYVVVFTKADKKNSPRELIAHTEATKLGLNTTGCPIDTPIILTSSETNLGRENIWTYLRLAMNEFVSPVKEQSNCQKSLTKPTEIYASGKMK